MSSFTMGEVNPTLKNMRRNQSTKMPRRIKDMSREALQATLTKKRECNAKALQVVEQLLESRVSEHWFLDHLRYINDSHFQDIVEERAITKLCGYPLCYQKLKNVPNQQFRISTKSNKVYDITERKNFCSNQCYKAGKFVKDQLLTSPLWLRDREEIPDFTVLPVNITGCVGEEVDLGQSVPLKDEVVRLQKSSQLSKGVEKKKQVETKCENDPQDNLSCVKAHHEDQGDSIGLDCLSVLETKEAISDSCSDNSSKSIKSVVSNVNSITSLLSNVHLNIDSTKEKDVNYEVKTDATKQESGCTTKETCQDVKLKVQISCNRGPTKGKSKTRKSDKHEQSKKSNGDIPCMTSAIFHIEKCLHEWCTLDTMCFLFGEVKVKEMVSDKGESLKEYYKAAGSVAWDQTVQERYATICRRLDLAELRDEARGEQLRPLPDYAAVQADGHALEFKVHAFYQGKSSFESPETVISKPKEAENTSLTMIPLVDLHAQNALRRRIVLDRLNRVVPDLLRTFGMSSYDVGGSVRLLISSFSLSAHNITFQPAEWSLLGLIVIKMLSIKDTRLKILLDSEQARKYLTMMLMVFQVDGGYLDRLLALITDVDTLLYKQQLVK